MENCFRCMSMTAKTTVSLIKCDVGSLAGHYVVPEPLLNIAEKNLRHAQEKGLINSYHVSNAGDDLQLLMVHQKGESNHVIHELACTLRRMGEFEPARLGPEEMEYTALRRFWKD